MATNYTVQQGDHLSSIAAKFGFLDYHTIWDHPNNAGLKQKRQNPNVLYPGDSLYIPDKQLKKEARPTGKRHRFKRPGPSLMLRIVVKNVNDEPIANTACKLQVEGQTYQLTTDGNGKIEQEIPATAQSGNLAIQDWNLPIKIGYMDPVDELTGWQARLNNLGYRAGTSTDLNDPQLRSAIEEFQCDQHINVDGICGPVTQAKLKKAHGC